ncbi:glycosyltransferase involved in cell wall biosynthesis [Clostridium beijerinckii]|uniref:glycosyltransferase n=1 Tax=Clostridium beijerinckii TaxID=1520 RepID=UPI001494A9F2|nr:glycosyltransferase [Clostridium beijerinckii]NOW85438.1 glycosyltransferase involved in cell wall biosynthesis [Clostridium beijerinckii]
MNKIMIISPIEFGLLIDHVKWIKYLNSYYNLEHISISNKKNFCDKNIKFTYVKRKNKLIKNIYFILYVRHKIRTNNPKCVIIDYFPGCSLIKFLNSKTKFILDIRTMTISDNILKKHIRDFVLKMETKVFKEITVISEKIGKKLKLKKFTILPLGADKFVDDSNLIRENSKLKLLYIGVFHNRQIDKTILAIKRALDMEPNINMEYNIIGYSKNINENKYLRNIINENKLQSYIKIIGKVSSENLGPYLKNSNVGLAYIPKKKYFDLQSPTKVYEYVVNGLYCIATNTTANKEIITEKNGIIVEDSIEELAKAIIKVNKIIKDIDYVEVAESLSNYKWSNIVKNILVSVINKNMK